MSQGQGSVSYNGPAAAAGGGGAVAGARNGLSIDGITDVVLGQDIGAIGNPAALLSDREIPMQQHVINFKMAAPPLQIFEIGDQNGGAGQEIPTRWYSDNSSFWSTWEPANYGIGYGAFGVGERFYSGYALYPGVNEPVTARPNMVGLFWSYNTGFTSGRVNNAEAAFRFATESFFVIGVDPYFEFHIPEITDSAGNIFRIMSWYIDRGGGASTIGFAETVIDDWTWYSRGFNPSGGSYYAHLEYNATADNSIFAIKSQFAAGVTEFILGSWTDPSSFMTSQSGLFNINAPVDIDLRSPRVIMDSTTYGNIVNPTIFSDSNIDAPLMDAWLEVGGVTKTKGSRPMPIMNSVQWAALTPTVGFGGLQVWVSDAPAGQQWKVWDGAAWHFVNVT
jgi:hypothetical protein